MPSFITTDLPALTQFDLLEINPVGASIGIDEVRQIQTFLSRKPQYSPKSAVVIHSAHLLTLPAQHALLKTLEEPPEYADIYLLTSKPDLLLPTIQSRSFISIPNRAPAAADPQTQPKIPAFVSAKSPGEKLQLLESISTRDQLSMFLDQLELYLHSQITTNPQLAIANWPPLTTARRYLSANCSLRLIVNFLSAPANN